MTTDVGSPSRIALDWIDEEFERTEDLTEAIERVSERLIAAGVEPLFEEMGKSWLREMWWGARRSARRSFISPGQRVHSTTPSGVGSPEETPSANGVAVQRRVDAGPAA